MPQGRPKGSKNKIKTQEVEVITTKRGRPPGSKNKNTVVEPTTTVETPTKQKRGRPLGSINVPKASYVPEPIRGFQEVMVAFGAKGYFIYCNTAKMELLPEDMEKAVEKFRNAFSQMPIRAILNFHNEKLLPYLYAQVPNLECGIAGGTATWEIKFQVP
jgi:hypothetical protein